MKKLFLMAVIMLSSVSIFAQSRGKRLRVYTIVAFSFVRTFAP